MNDWYDAEQRVERAKELFDQHKWSEALAELRAAVAINPYNGGWLFNIGLTLDEMERYDEAIEAYRESLEIEPDDVEALNRLGADLSRVGRYGEALKKFEQIESLDSEYEPSYCARIVVYREIGDHDQAEQMFYLARQYKDECPHCFYHIGQSLADRRVWDKAIYCWQKCLDLDSDYPEVHLRMAEAYEAKGKFERARQHYLMDLRQDPGNVDTLLDLGNLLIQMERNEEASEKFRRAIELVPEHASAHFCYGRWLADAGRTEDAIVSFLRTLQLDPTYSGAHLHLGRIYLGRHDRDAARRHLRNEHLLQPDDPQVMLELSNLLLDCGESSVAVVCLKRLTHVEPDNASAWQNLAVAYFYGERFDEGITASREALRCDPAHLMAMYNLAVAYEQLRNYPDALRWVRAGLVVDPRGASFQRLEIRLRVLQFRNKLKAMFRSIFPLSRRKTLE